MEILRKLGLLFGKTIIGLSIIASGLGFIYFSTLSRPEKVKLWLNDSNLYPAIAETIQEQFLSENNNIDQVPRPIIEEAVAKTFNPETAQTFFEDNIDSMYNWLESSSSQEELTLEINIEDFQQELVANLNDGLLAELNSLPACSAGTIPSSTNLLELRCIPQGFNINEEVNAITSQIDLQANEEQDQANITVNPEEEPKQEDIGQNLRPFKNIYGFLSNIAYIAAGLFIVGAAIVVALSKPRYKSIKTLAIIAIPYGVIYILGGIFVPKIISSAAGSSIDSLPKEQLKEPLERLVGSVGGSIGTDLLYVGIGLLVVGIILSVIYTILNKKYNPKAHGHTHKPDVHHPQSSKPEHTSS